MEVGSHYVNGSTGSDLVAFDIFVAGSGRCEAKKVVACVINRPPSALI